MGTRDAYQKVIIRACIICGDETSFAKALGAPVEDVVDWVLGDRPVPPDYFLKAVDIVLADSKQHVIEVKTFLEKVRGRRPVRGKKT